MALSTDMLEANEVLRVGMARRVIEDEKLQIVFAPMSYRPAIKNLSGCGERE